MALDIFPVRKNVEDHFDCFRAATTLYHGHGLIDMRGGSHNTTALQMAASVGNFNPCTVLLVAGGGVCPRLAPLWGQERFKSGDSN